MATGDYQIYELENLTLQRGIKRTFMRSSASVGLVPGTDIRSSNF